MIVPSAAIQRSPQATFVYVGEAGPDRRDARRSTIQRVEGDETAVKSGVAAGDVVVTDGVDKLQQGTRVVVQARGRRPTVRRRRTP